MELRAVTRTVSLGAPNINPDVNAMVRAYLTRVLDREIGAGTHRRPLLTRPLLPRWKAGKLTPLPAPSVDRWFAMISLNRRNTRVAHLTVRLLADMLIGPREETVEHGVSVMAISRL